MARVKGGFTSKRRHNKTFKYVKGFTGAKSKIWRRAHEAMLHSMAYSYRDRHNRKRDFRRLWIARINAASRINGLSYSRFIAGLKATGVEVNRKVLADIAICDAAAFAELAAKAKLGLASK
jgi:large subunit ribosomal protein L20